MLTLQGLPRAVARVPAQAGAIAAPRAAGRRRGPCGPRAVVRMNTPMNSMNTSVAERVIRRVNTAASRATSRTLAPAAAGPEPWRWAQHEGQVRGSGAWPCAASAPAIPMNTVETSERARADARTQNP